MKVAVLLSLSLSILTLEADGHIISATKLIPYELKKPLEVGDVIRAWGVYKDDTTSRFSVRIGQGSSSGPVLFVADFRMWDDLVVLNNKENRRWQTEIRARLGRHNFEADKVFEVKIEVEEEGYKVFVNDNELERSLPHRMDISRGEHVELTGGSNGFKWTALHLPSPEGQTLSDVEVGPSIPFETTTGHVNSLSLLERSLAPGDVITAWGIYAAGTEPFCLNLMMENGLYHMFHVDFRPSVKEGDFEVVMNSKDADGWAKEIQTKFMANFENGRPFKVAVKCLEDAFQIFVDGADLGTKFPYRENFALGEAKFLWLLGGSEGMTWTDALLPSYQSFRHVFAADKDVKYGLKKQLQVADVIRAWGIFKDYTTSRFSVSIGGTGDVLFVVDFRPWDDLVVMNSYSDNQWKREVRLAFSKENFKMDSMFEVTVEVSSEGFHTFLNGKRLEANFLHRVDLVEGQYVTLYGGSHGFQWTALHLPNGKDLGPGIPFETSSGSTAVLERPLLMNNIITAWGIFAAGSADFAISLQMSDPEEVMLQVTFRPDKIVLLSSNNQQNRVIKVDSEDEMPFFMDGTPFKVAIKCLGGGFQIFLNGKSLVDMFPYNSDFELRNVNSVQLTGGSAGMQWTDLALPYYDDQAVGLRWFVFSETKQASIKLSLAPGEIEIFFLRLPCDINMSFKLGLRRYGGLNAHVEIKGQRGYVYCDGAVNRNWFNGETTSFNLGDALDCKPEQNNVILVFEKTPDRLTVKTSGEVVYNQVFTASDGYCHSQVPSTHVWTNLQRYDGELELAVGPEDNDEQ